MTSFKLLLCCLSAIFISAINAAANPPRPPFRAACVTAQAQTDLNINKVRARLTTGGDLWWDRSDPAYVVPANPAGGAPEVSASSASAIWMGGLDPGGNLKLACQTYGNSSNNSEFWPGPLGEQDGTTSAEICTRWDRFFEVKSVDIREHLRLFQESRNGGAVYVEDQIPLAVRGWPARGNPHFFDVHQFALPGTDQGLADFYDNDGNGFYEPLRGDYPLVQTRGCEASPLPDQLIFWIFNDQGGGALHGETDGIPIRMEVQAEAFAYATNDPLDYVTFYKYKLINRALEDIDSTYFGIWADFDLGCYGDDFLGCDTSRNMIFVYNEDEADGEPGTSCNFGGATYGKQIPAMGIDLIRGPLNEFREELGMSSFTYYVRPFEAGMYPPGMKNPYSGSSYYNYLSGSWADGTRFTYGGDAPYGSFEAYGYDPQSDKYTSFAFPSEPNNQNGWSMCSHAWNGHNSLAILSSGPFLLKPGAINELIFSAIWVPNLDYPCPDLSKLRYVSDLAETLFDGCVHFSEGPDAPDVNWKENDREFVAYFSNDSNSNNFEENYEERGYNLPSGNWDTTYNFEGYVLYQLKYASVTAADLGDSTKAKIAAQVDIQNGVGKIYQWQIVDNPSAALRPYDYDFTYVPKLVLDGADQGIPDSIIITEDLFSTGSDRRLLNHRKYYFMAIAYAHNEYLPFDAQHLKGQQIPFLGGGKRNVKLYTVIPRPTQFGEDPLATVNLVPNPYFAFSAYETDQQPDIVKITNLPAQCTVTIYSLDGGFVRRFNRHELPSENGQFLPDLDWDLRNQKGNKVASGVFLVHVKAPGIGERTLKWFGTPRKE